MEENTSKKVIHTLLEILMTVCNENDLNYIFAVEDKNNKLNSELWCAFYVDTEFMKAKQIIADYFYR